MQKHLEVLASLASRLEDLSRQLSEVKKALDEELDRASSFLPAGGTSIGMAGAESPSGLPENADLADKATVEAAPVEPPLRDLSIDPASQVTLDDFEAVSPATEVEPADPEQSREGGDEASLFEPLLDFNLVRSISLADTFFYANELFFGNKAQLEDMLIEIERLSSMSQVENYLYEVREFSREDPSIQRLMSFIMANASVRR